ncbi:LOW QUALITY PROTEIN: hypothetical protein V1477_014143 [Vespula maculifrons]|uniref:Uncharacterized protein n=1 Tax=Vespula maculifrons TaxID=7453 RepID=A0ABD2BK67_VESMC
MYLIITAYLSQTQHSLETNVGAVQYNSTEISAASSSHKKICNYLYNYKSKNNNFILLIAIEKLFRSREKNNICFEYHVLKKLFLYISHNILKRLKAVKY